MDVGHALLGEQGEMLSLDEGFCTILRTEARDMVGRGILDITVPADRTTCRDLMRNLCATREPFKVRKQFLRGDGSTVWVSNIVSIVQFGDAPRSIISTIIPIDAPGDRQGPAIMLDTARFMLRARSDRDAVFGLSLFREPAWDIILTAYVIEAEGGMLDLETLATATAIPVPLAGRWAKALAQEGLIEREPGRGDCYRLTARAHRKCETYLSGVLARTTAVPERVGPR